MSQHYDNSSPPLKLTGENSSFSSTPSQCPTHEATFLPVGPESGVHSVGGHCAKLLTKDAFPTEDLYRKEARVRPDVALSERFSLSTTSGG